MRRVALLEYFKRDQEEDWRREHSLDALVGKVGTLKIEISGLARHYTISTPGHCVALQVRMTVVLIQQNSNPKSKALFYTEREYLHLLKM